jgi:glutamyl-tRNA reductase
MLLTVLGINHKTAPLELLERVVFAPEDLGRATAALADRVAHGVILSTCNRVEVYGLVGHPDSGRRELLRFLAEYHGMRPSALEPHVYVYSQEEAARHLFRVAAGLDSMMVGETQVLGQVRAAYTLAHHRTEPGPVLARLFHQAVGVGRRTHRETRIEGVFGSLSAAAVDLARERLGDLGSRTALVVGGL